MFRLSPRSRVSAFVAVRLSAAGLAAVVGACAEGELGVKRLAGEGPAGEDALVSGPSDAARPGGGFWPSAGGSPGPDDPDDPDEPANPDDPDATSAPPTTPPTSPPTTPPTSPPTSPPTAPAPADCSGGRWTLEANGQRRSARVDVPGGYGAGGPLVLALHGNGDTADNFCATSGVCAFAAARGALVITPDGRERVISAFGQQIPGSWDAYNPDPGGNEDLALADALIAEADTRCAPGPVYVWGHSQGGYFGFALAMRRAERVAGAVVSAAADPTPGLQWQPARRIPFYFLIGDADFGIDNARQTAAALESAGHPVHLEVLPGVGHGGYQDGREAEIWAFVTQGG
ncbi:dienelactone hydrolase family protein [Myxococcota bacterium]|nr:dienelactone hydrolase family protein [Myxococcota bacterium]